MDRIDEVYDVAALRVVVPHKHDCYRALREVEALWAPVPGRFKDYIRHRKGNGYQSLHATVLAGAADDLDQSGLPAGGGCAAASMLEVQIRTPKMHYIAEYGFAAHWRYKEKLSREDVWLDRLVQWKKWVATEKLRLRDAKVRAGGSPQRDLALAGLVEAAQAAAAEVQPPLSLPEAAAPPAGALSSRPAPGAPSPLSSVSDLDARFMARFSIRPVSEADLRDHAASILISGPRGVRVADVPGGCTVAQLLSGGAVTEQEARGCSLRVNGEAVPLLAARDVRLRPGDHVAFVEEPTLAPRAPQQLAPAAAAAKAVAAGGGAADGGRMMDTLDVYLPGQSAPVEVALRRPSGAGVAAAGAGAAASREAALVS